MSQYPPPPYPTVPPPVSAPGSITPQTQAIQDAEHLRVLSICYYILAGLEALGGFFPALYFCGGCALIGIGASHHHGGGPAGLGLLMVLFGSCVSILIWAQAALNFAAARGLAHRHSRTIIFIAAALNCLHVPLGLALGVFTFLVMGRPSVQALFTGNPLPAA